MSNKAGTASTEEDCMELWGKRKHEQIEHTHITEGTDHEDDDGKTVLRIWSPYHLQKCMPTVLSIRTITISHHHRREIRGFIHRPTDHKLQTQELHQSTPEKIQNLDNFSANNFLSAPNQTLILCLGADYKNGFGGGLIASETIHGHRVQGIRLYLTASGIARA